VSPILARPNAKEAEPVTSVLARPNAKEQSP
jgi:hypothetical protein